MYQQNFCMMFISFLKVNTDVEEEAGKVMEETKLNGGIKFLAEEFQQAIPRRHQSFVVCHSYWRRLVQTQPLFDGGGVLVPFQVFPLSEAFVLPLQLQPEGQLQRFR